MLWHVLQMPNGLSQAGASQLIQISNSRCDQMLVTSIWCIISHTARSITMNGAFSSCGHSQLLPVVCAAAKVIDEQGHVYTAVAHEVLYDDNPSSSSPCCLPTSRYPILAMLLMIGHAANRTFAETQVCNLPALMTRIFRSILMGANVSLK